MIATRQPLKSSEDVQGRSLWVDARRRLVRNRAAMAAITVLTLMTLMAIFAPFLSPFRYDAINYDLVTCAPSWWPGAGLNAP